MKKVYLVCTRSAITASALTYIINQSPDFYKQSHNNLWLEEHSEWFGVAHIINDWWNVSDQLRPAYDPDFRNNVVLSREKLHALVDLWQANPSDKHICLFTHARNTEDIMRMVQEDNLPVVVITTLMGNNCQHFMEAFLRREYNDEMNDYDGFFEAWKYTYYQLTAQDSFWKEHNHHCFSMDEWLHTPKTIHEQLGVAVCEDIDQWTEQYLRQNSSDNWVNHDYITPDAPIATKVEFLVSLFNKYTSHLENGSQRIKFAIVLYDLYMSGYTMDRNELVNDTAKQIGLRLTEELV